MAGPAQVRCSLPWGGGAGWCRRCLGGGSLSHSHAWAGSRGTSYSDSSPWSQRLKQRLNDSGGILFISPQCTPTQLPTAGTCNSVWGLFSGHWSPLCSPVWQAAGVQELQSLPLLHPDSLLAFNQWWMEVSINTKAPLPWVGCLTMSLHWLPESWLSSSCPRGNWLDNVHVPFFRSAFPILPHFPSYWYFFSSQMNYLHLIMGSASASGGIQRRC